MDYMKEVWSVISYVEQRIRTDIDYQELERITGFSYRHLREVFKQTTGTSLSRYINERKSANAAVMLAHTDKSATEIAFELGFESYDTFTRVFKRAVGLTPSDFRQQGGSVSSRRLGVGLFAPVISAVGEAEASPPLWMEENNMDRMRKDYNSCVLYGVPKVHFGLDGWQCSPYPMCLKAVLNYMGQEIAYPYLMAASGMAFRLRWNSKEWDPGNVGIQVIYTDPEEGYRKALRAAGRDGYILRRQGQSTEEKELFKTLICRHLDQGHPLISVGVAGPPEAGIVTGYKNGGDTLLGWSLFQENMEFAGSLSFDESGYYITDSWWETVECIIAVGEPLGECTSLFPLQEIVENGLIILQTEEIETGYGERTYWGGQAAYRAWAEAVADDRNFPEQMIFPLLMERLMCQSDAETMVAEGRHCAAGFMRWLAGQFPAAQEDLENTAKYFDDTCAQIQAIMEMRNGYEQTETTLRKFADPDIRKQISARILAAAECEVSAAEALSKAAAKMQ